MKRIIATMLTAVVLSQSGICQEVNIYQQSPYHETGVVAVKNGAAEMLSYSAFPQRAANGNTYYRWYTSPGYPNFIGWPNSDGYYSEASAIRPLTQGYRFADGKMYVYDFTKEKESIGLDFTLKAGECFTTPDGTLWTVESREQRSFTTLYGKGRQIDYQAEHAVLKVKSIDGTKTDEWIENLGAVHYPLMIQPTDGVELAHVAYMNYSMESPYLVLDFSEAPLYGCYVGDVEKSEDTEESQTIANTTEGLTFTVNRYGDYQTRYYCFAYQTGSNFNVSCKELGPYLDSENVYSRLQFSFSGIPAGNYTANVFGHGATTGIRVTRSQTSPATIHDLHGRKLNCEPEEGMYIKNGKVIRRRN